MLTTTTRSAGRAKPDMAHVAPSRSLREIAEARLDHLIAEVKHSQDSRTELLLEHLQSARTYLLGAMHDEYRFSLMEAYQIAPQAGDPALERAVVPELGVLLEQIPDPPHEPQIVAVRRISDDLGEDGQKTELYRFFHGSATTLGVFYPTHYIFGSFPSLENAKKAAKTLQSAGFVETVVASSAETYRFMNEIRCDVGLWGALMASISRFFGTEEVFADITIAKAEEGAAFLAVYCRREEHADRIRDLIMPFEPLAMQLYLPGGIRSLVAGRSPGPQGTHPQQN